MKALIIAAFATATLGLAAGPASARATADQPFRTAALEIDSYRVEIGWPEPAEFRTVSGIPMYSVPASLADARSATPEALAAISPGAGARQLGPAPEAIGAFAVLLLAAAAAINMRQRHRG